MPVIHVNMLKGKTTEQKKIMVESITEAVVKAINVEPEKVTIFINEFEKEEIGKGGRLYTEIK
ncbi:4-oxalocrotonate tautomerase [Thermanaerosceptrum fracticalcis]|uniref:Tautomerase n=1 Tax=Thermanaerosceptrum fracticalcis TaxID=1712410 RepID=A0A7G6E2M7_THEFR|nr:2-hydroxymuconate tautomerase [Thermanaerosceptrum fracticalcis]QNB46331.1 4-oxalocrotonate tautomerase [Thermanaerosceptrum fracticalcis]